MVAELSSSNLQQIEVFSRWHGFAHPPTCVAKLTITCEADRFVRQDDLTGKCDALPGGCVTQLFEQLSQPAVELLDPTLFDVPEPVIRSHFDSMWTDDNPEVLIRMKFSGGRIIDVLTTGQHVYLLPIQVRDSGGLLNYKTFQPALSRSMAALMPEGYLQRDRLEGTCFLLQEEIDDYRNGTGVWQIRSDAGGALDSTKQSEGEGLSWDEMQKRMNETIHRLHFRLESSEEKESAERSGKISERLLKNLSPDEMANILSRGGDPNVADESGQTALMLAAFPPLHREQFRMLARAGANLEARRTGDGATGLHLACGGGMTETVEEWIRAGADIHARQPEGATPLMLGALWLPIVRMLLASGARVNDVDRDGHTALVYAIHGQCWFRAVDEIEAIRMLIDAGTDLTLRDREGLTPLGFARRHYRNKLLEREADSAVRQTSGGQSTAAEEHKQSELMKTILRESYPNADPDKWNDLTMAETVVNLVAVAGGTD